MANLRERRREQTAGAIRQAAINLAYQHGLDHITTEMISEAAGISPRTFFNYFPFKEAALAPPRVDIEESDKRRFVQSKGNLLADLAIFLTPMLLCVGQDREATRRSYEISLTAPKLLALNNTLFLEFEDLMATLLGARLGRDPASIELRHMAAVIGATVRMAFAAWVEEGSLPLGMAVEQRLLALETLFAQMPFSVLADLPLVPH